MNYAIAVIDIGMTNKKVAIYDDSLKQLDAQYRVFEPLIINGLECHNLDVMEDWFIDTLKNFALKYPIKALAVSAHGATFVCVGENGKNVLPCVYYTHEPLDFQSIDCKSADAFAMDFHQQFYDYFGKPEELQARTGTPAFKAMINPAKGIFFLQNQFKEDFNKIKYIMLYPHYWGFRFTGKIGSENTYMGNHTYLWDQVDNCLSDVAHKLGITSLLSNKLKSPWDILGQVSQEFAARTGLPKETIVTMGIHDSNSAMLPHFAKKGMQKFILNSTGTWCVIMNPVDKYSFAPDELGKVVFFNISAFGTPIKTAIFLGGLEFETWSAEIFKWHNRDDFPEWNEELYRTILKDKKVFLLPELTQGSGQFPLSKARIVEDGINYFYDNDALSPPCFDDYEKSFAVLRISIVMQTLTALERAGIDNNCEIYTEGGFRKDESYNRLLASALVNKVFLTDVKEAAAFGAAMCAKMAISGKSIDELSMDFDLSYIEQKKSSLPELEEYRKAWLKEVERI